MTLPRANRRLTLRTAAVLLALAVLAILFVGTPTASADDPPQVPSADPPEAPRGLRVYPGGSQELVASWRAPYDDGGSPITEYRVQWKSSSQNYDDSASSPRQAVIADPARLTYTIGGLGAEQSTRCGSSPPTALATAHRPLRNRQRRIRSPEMNRTAQQEATARTGFTPGGTATG